MPKFAFVINGQNFKMNFEGKTQKVGFFATRRVENDDVDAAEKVALDSVRSEFGSLVLNDRDDPPVMYIENIYEVDSFDDDPVPGEGATWYIENDEEGE